VGFRQLLRVRGQRLGLGFDESGRCYFCKSVLRWIQEILAADDRRARFGFKRLAGVAGDMAAFPGGGSILGKTLCGLFQVNLGCAGLAQHGEDQFEIGHVVAEVFTGLYPVQTFDLAVFAGRYPEGGVGAFRSKPANGLWPRRVPGNEG
jgi:hypothetical protein